MTTTTREIVSYRCTGSVRGSCGHTHRTLSGAQSCLSRDVSGCHSQGGYSDRRIDVYYDGDRVGYLEGDEALTPDGRPLRDPIDARPRPYPSDY